MATRIGVDVGGTFTDLIFYDDETGEVRVDKEPTTPAAPEHGVIAAVETTLARWRARPRAATSCTARRSGLNSLLTRTGAVVGLLCTTGLPRHPRDPPRRPRRALQPVLAPRRRRSSRAGCGSPVTERIRADGDGARPLRGRRRPRRGRGLRGRGRRPRSRSPSSTPTRTPRTSSPPRARSARPASTGEISLSHQVSGEYREYERTSTTVIDAYVRGRDGELPAAARGRPRATRASSGSLLVTRSGGGAMTFAEAERAAVRDDHVRAGRRRRRGRRAGTEPRARRTSSPPTSAARASTPA